MNQTAKDLLLLFLFSFMWGVALAFGVYLIVRVTFG